MEENIGKLKKVGNWFSAILLGNTRELIARIDEKTNRILEDLKDIKPKVDDMCPKVDILWTDIKDIKPKVDDMCPKVDILWADRVAPAHSPRRLNDYGNKILTESGIKEIIKEKKPKLLELVKAEKATNVYDAEMAVLSVVKKLPEHCPDVIDKLKTGAFNAGASLDTVLLVGGLYLRDLVFPELGFSVEDLDRPKTK